jgi:hypothetical protein
MYATSKMKTQLKVWCNSVTGLRSMGRKKALQTANELSGQRAHQIWCALQILEKNSPREGLLRPVTEMAMDLQCFPEAWKVIAFKGALYERLSGKRNR